MSKRKRIRKIWMVVNDNDGNDSFEVDGCTFVEAAQNALKELGWWISTPSLPDEDEEGVEVDKKGAN